MVILLTTMIATHDAMKPGTISYRPSPPMKLEFQPIYATVDTAGAEEVATIIPEPDVGCESKGVTFSSVAHYLRKLAARVLANHHALRHCGLRRVREFGTHSISKQSTVKKRLASATTATRSVFSTL